MLWATLLSIVPVPKGKCENSSAVLLYSTLEGHVFQRKSKCPMTRVALHHHRGRLEDGHGDLRH